MKTLTEKHRAPQTSNHSDDVAHIVMKRDQMLGYIEGIQIIALCGKKWVPSKDPQDLPLCQKCVDEKDRMVAGMRNFN